jgi:hypothetical protein
MRRVEKVYDTLDAFLATCQTPAVTKHKDRDNWHGATHTQALKMVREGWADAPTEYLDIAESALTTVVAAAPPFEPVWDVSGSFGDVELAIQGVPECMAEMAPVEVSRAGRIVTLVFSYSYSAAVGPSAITKRGGYVMGLVLALEKLGQVVELWADFSGQREGSYFSFRTLIKGTHDVLSPDVVAFITCHPAMLRRLGFSCAVANGVPNYGIHDPTAPPQDKYPEGTIFINEMMRGQSDTAETSVLKTLRELGLIDE